MRVPRSPRGQGGTRMKGSRKHTPEQIVRKPREADRLLGEGKLVAALAKELGVSEHIVPQPAKLLGIVGLHAPVLVAPAPKGWPDRADGRQPGAGLESFVDIGGLDCGRLVLLSQRSLRLPVLRQVGRHFQHCQSGFAAYKCQNYRPPAEVRFLMKPPDPRTSTGPSFVSSTRSGLGRLGRELER